MSDDFSSIPASLNSPSISNVAVTPSDSQDLAKTSRGLYIGHGGDVNILAAGDASPVLFANVQSGSIIPTRTKRVYLTGTTATGIVAMS